jgi:SAM-dependent methyltransferase
MDERQLQEELKRAYELRFAKTISYRKEVWRILCKDYFSAYVPKDSTVLDLGSGYGWFINSIECARKFAMELNTGVAQWLDDEVVFLNQDCSKTWNLEDDSLDIVFTSNFLEHLLTKEHLKSTLLQARRCLRAGGKIIALGPNAKFLAGRYWDFLDHHIALTEQSLWQALELNGFRIEVCIPRFLPYTMVSRTPPLFLVKAYLRLPFAWRFFGKQFLLMGTKERAATETSPT